MSLMMCPMFEESKPPLDKALMIVFESPSKITCFRLSSCAKPMALRAANTSTISTEVAATPSHQHGADSYEPKAKTQSLQTSRGGYCGLGRAE
nr:hypothetical protein CFP56_77612 [Quercus suber]